MSDPARIVPVAPYVPQMVPSGPYGAGKVQVFETLQDGAADGDLAQGRVQLRDLRQLKAALESDSGAIREAFEAGIKNGTIETTLRQLSTAELGRLTNALPEDETGPDSRAAFASMVSRMPALPFDRETLRALRAALVSTGYQGDIDRFDLAYPTR
ncbi:MAG: hypothetical protein ACAI38_00810 [Myxococcota bacterium]|nr:hypothetical protein [Myxococcota bacterium]